MSGQEELQGLEVFSLFQALRVAPSPLLGSGMAVSGLGACSVPAQRSKGLPPFPGLDPTSLDLPLVM